ncbi:hypothetical protein ACQKQD_17950 [Methylobacterium sp. NPDC080182]|uniref:hypothetical protein n=1 Tax=Methylobacterium sp. NPDC080182 TaxID=3390590 RepID=UPI003CFED746
MPPDQPNNPGREDELAALLCLALDGTDADRVRYLVQFIDLRKAQHREADLDRLREAGIGPVWTL